MSRTPRTPPPNLTPAELARKAEFWGLKTGEIKALLFVRTLVEQGRIGKGDQK